MEAMDLEHCHSYGFDAPFTTSSNQITTTPAKEWAVVVRGVQAENTDRNRRIRPLKECMQLSLVQLAGLIEPEVIAVILFTGPLVSARRLSRSLPMIFVYPCKPYCFAS